MLEARRLSVNIRLETDDFRNVLRALAGEGWTPVIITSEAEFLRLAGLENDHPLRVVRANSWGRDRSAFGDVFFREQDLFYCLSNESSGMTFDTKGRMQLIWQEGTQTLEVGLISLSAPGLDERLRNFADILEKAVMRVVDGR
jgi:hypothetical protein